MLVVGTEHQYLMGWVLPCGVGASATQILGWTWGNASQNPRSGYLYLPRT